MAGGEYGVIRQTFWTDPDIKRALTPEQKTLLLYYFSSPHGNLVGLYYCPFVYAATETGVPVETVREWTMGPLSRFVTYDEHTEEVLVHRTGRHRVGDELKDGDKRIKAVERVLAEAHSPALINRFLDLYAEWPLSVERLDAEAPSEPLASPSEANSVTVTDQDQLQEEDANASLSGSDEPNTDGPSVEKARQVREVFTHWQQVSGHDKAKLTGERRAKINARLRTYSVEELKRAVDGACANPFYQGDNDRGQRYDFPETIFKSDSSTEKHMLYTPPGGTATASGALPVFDWSEEQIAGYMGKRPA